MKNYYFLALYSLFLAGSLSAVVKKIKTFERHDPRQDLPVLQPTVRRIQVQGV